MAVLTTLHLVIGIAFLVICGALAIWAFVYWRRHAPLPDTYWRALRLPTGLLVLQILLGLFFLTRGLHPGDPLHLMYAGLAAAGVAAMEGLRPKGALGRMMRREDTFNEAGAYALIAAVVALLAMRLWQTGPHA